MTLALVLMEVLNMSVPNKSSKEKKRENFARIPNMVFVSFKFLTKEEKYLYAHLQCIYWDTKTHIASLRELSDLTEYSVSALSKMLPRIHDCGLIRAEIKREKDKKGQEIGNPKYHITILDIWELNKIYFESSAEARAKLDPSLKLVHKKEQESANPVHENEQACSPNSTRSFTKTNRVVSPGEQVHARFERAKDNNKDSFKDFSKGENSDPSNSSQNDNPTNSSSPSSPEKEFADHFAFLMKKVTGVENYKAVPLTKSHKDYALFQELVNRNPSLEEMERVLLTFWHEQDKDKSYFWRKPGTLKLNTYCRNYDAKLNAAMPQNANESHEKGVVQGMTRDNAVELEKEIVATTSKHGYEVQASVIEQDGQQVVKVLWRGRTIKIESASRWHEVFETMQEIILEESQELQLA